MTALRTLFPATRPSLLLDFANGKRLDPRINFTRNSSGTYFDRFGVLKTAAVNEPRFTHDPVTGESLGLMVEEQRTNLLTYSEQFDNAAWSLTRATVTANAITAPDGTTTAEKLVEDATAANTHRIQFASGYAFVSGMTYVYSVYAKAAERSWIYTNFHFQSTGSAFGSHGAYFNLSTGTTGTAVGVTSTIEDAGNGWYRCTIIGTASASLTSNPGVFLAEDNGDIIIDGDGTSGIYIWGAQLEAGSFPTSYIKTEASQATRAADDCNILFGNNLLTYSEQFDNAAWIKVNATITANAITAPDGTMTADKLVATAVSSNHYVSQVPTLIDNSDYAFSVYVKSGEYTEASINTRSKSGTFRSVIFSLVDGSVISGPFNGLVVDIQPVGNDWFRCSGVFNADAGATSPSVFVYPASGGTTNYTGDGTSGIYIWGAQLEQSSAPNPYVRTVESPVTGKVWNDWFNAAEGSVYVESLSLQGNASYPYSLFGKDTLNRIYNNYGTIERMQSGIRINGSFDAIQHSAEGSAPSNAFGKGSSAYKQDDFGFSWNGANTLTDNSVSLPWIEKLTIGSNSDLANNWLNGTIKKLSYYPVRLSNINLQSLTRNN